MNIFPKKDEVKENYNIRILDSIENINNKLKKNGYILKKYSYDLEIYMINKNQNFSKIHKISDITDYAIIKDENGERKVILNNGKVQKAKLYSVFLAHELLYNLGYYQLFYINKDIYCFEINYNYNTIYFKIIDIKEQGCFLEIFDITFNKLQMIIKDLNEIGINVDKHNLNVDNIQEELNKVLYKSK